MVPPLDDLSTRRRTLLAALGSGSLAATSGCLGRVRSMTGWQSPEPVALDIKTVPVDADPNAVRITRLLSDWFDRAGIDTSVTPMSDQELLRDVLLNHDYDLFVLRVPPRFQEPDALFSFLHSQFAASRGWQNPFGYTDLETDELLETQRRASGNTREEAVADLQRTIARTNPFTVVGFPDEIRAARTDRYTNWRNTALRSPYGYLRVVRTGDNRWTTGEDSEGARSAGELRIVATDSRPTENLNPIAVEFRGTGVFTGLLYDSLGYPTEDDSVDPWLAETWSITETGDGPRARIRLREGLAWHDGHPLTASDVEFTYRFLADTTLNEGGEEGDPIPAPSYQGRTTLVSSVDPVDDRTVDVQFVECDPGVASRALTVPILPAHVWRERTSTVSLGGIEIGAATEAIVTDNLPPVGSGPLRFVENEPREQLVLERFDDHFLTREAESVPSDFAGGPAFDRLTVSTVGSDSTAVELVSQGDADITGTALSPGVVPRIGRSEELSLLVDRSESFYVVGYNARDSPLGNPRFRNALAHLIDKQYISRDVFRGYARPASSPLDGTRWLPPDLEWVNTDPVTPFRGNKGELDVDAARQELRDAGYRYEDGRLIEG